MPSCFWWFVSSFLLCNLMLRKQTTYSHHRLILHVLSVLNLLLLLLCFNQAATSEAEKWSQRGSARSKSTEVDSMWYEDSPTQRLLLAEKRPQGAGKHWLTLGPSVFVAMTRRQHSTVWKTEKFWKVQTFSTKSGRTKKAERSEKRRWEWSFFSRWLHAAAYPLSSLRTTEKMALRK